MLNLWWGITEQTYLYYWHHNVWAVLGAWAVVVLLFILVILIGEELWRASYEALGCQSAATTGRFLIHLLPPGAWWHTSPAFWGRQ